MVLKEIYLVWMKYVTSKDFKIFMFRIENLFKNKDAWIGVSIRFSLWKDGVVSLAILNTLEPLP